jgi:DNA-binding XRE family transcriptional regulator
LLSLCARVAEANQKKQAKQLCGRIHLPTGPVREVISSQVACLLKEERMKRGLSLNLLAERAGLSRQTVSYVDQEVRSPTLDTLLRITTAMGVDLEKIIARARKLASDEIE